MSAGSPTVGDVVTFSRWLRVLALGTVIVTPADRRGCAREALTYFVKVGVDRWALCTEDGRILHTVGVLTAAPTEFSSESVFLPARIVTLPGAAVLAVVDDWPAILARTLAEHSALVLGIDVVCACGQHVTDHHVHQTEAAVAAMTRGN